MAEPQPHAALAAPPPTTPVSAATHTAEPPSPAARVVTLILAGLVLLPQLLRATADFNPLPHWDSDPLTFIPSITGLTPGLSLALDTLVMAASMATLVLGWWPRGRVLAVASVAGAFVLAYWMNGSYADARLAGAWCSGMLGAVALAGLCREPLVRAVCAALLLGFIGLLLAKGAVQWFIEHPAAVEGFKRNRALILSSNGWEEGSSMARAYERRLMQREASGWFGLSNVYASFAAAFSIALAVLLIGLRRAGGGVLLALGVGVLCAATALAFAGSKGGFAAAALGAVAAGVLLWFRGRGWVTLAGGLGVALCALVIAGVVIRGLIGERLGELSLLFRWFYWQGAARMMADGPTGPAGFQDAYLLAKPPISPEEVQSAHNAAVDWLATLWWPGAAVLLVFLILLWRAGRAAASAAPATPPLTADAFARAAGPRAVLLALSLLTLGGLFLDRGLLTENVIAARLSGLALAAIIGLGVWHAACRAPRVLSLALSGAAITLAAHAMIEVTGTNQSSAGLWWSAIAIAAGAGSPCAERIRAAWRQQPIIFGVVALAVSAFVAASTADRFVNIDADLRRAADACRPVAEVNNLLLSAGAETDPLRRAGLLDEAKAIINASLPPGTPPDRAEPLMRERAAAVASPILRGAAQRARHWPISREAQRLDLLRITLTTNPQERTQLAQRVLNDAIAIASDDSAPIHHRVLIWSWLATVAGAVEPLGIAPPDDFWPSHTPPDGRTMPRLIEGALTRARQLDPYNPMHAQRLLALAQKQGWTDQIQGLAKELLAVDDLQRLDRDTRGLPDVERRRVEALARGTTP